MRFAFEDCAPPLWASRLAGEGSALPSLFTFLCYAAMDEIIEVCGPLGNMDLVGRAMRAVAKKTLNYLF